MRSLWIAAVLVPVLALTANAQVNVDVGPGGVKVDTPAGRVVGAIDTANSNVTFRSSKLVGMNVKNSKNQDLGKIEDLVIDERGHVRYAAISFGGFLGFNNKYFAVPWRSLKVKHDAGSSSYYVELNVTKEYLDAAHGFPSDKWPDFADPEMNKKIDAYWLRDEAKPATPTTLPRQ
jgi:sporulation protein YlmC with PRC-barrel domain